MLRELPAMLLLLTSASGVRAQDPGQPQRTWQDVRPHPELSQGGPVEGSLDVEVVVNAGWTECR